MCVYELSTPNEKKAEHLFPFDVNALHLEFFSFLLFSESPFYGEVQYFLCCRYLIEKSDSVQCLAKKLNGSTIIRSAVIGYKSRTELAQRWNSADFYI